MKNQPSKLGLRMPVAIALVWLGVFVWLGFQPTSNAASMSGQQDQQALIEQGSKLFNPTCSNAYCHGANGANGSAPPLRGRNFTADYLTRVISEGVPGTPMMGFKKDHSPEQIRALVAYVMSLPKGNAAAPPSSSSTTSAAPPPRRMGPEDQAVTDLMQAQSDLLR